MWPKTLESQTHVPEESWKNYSSLDILTQTLNNEWSWCSVILSVLSYIFFNKYSVFYWIYDENLFIPFQSCLIVLHFGSYYLRFSPPFGVINAFFHVWSFIFFHVTNIQISKDYNLSNHIISLLNLTAIAECLHFSRDLSDETKSLCQKLVCQMNYSEIHFACKCVLFPEVHTWFGAKLRNCSYSLNHFIASTLFFNALYSLHILQIWICKYVLLCDV